MTHWLCILPVAIAVAVTFSNVADAEEGAISTPQIISEFNRRNIGKAGIQYVTLRLKRNGIVTRTFEIARVFSQQQDAVRTVVTLLEPTPLAGLSYRISERAGGELEAIHIYLPAGNRSVLALNPSRFFEGLLGADFSYDDLRWQLPEAGWHYKPVFDPMLGPKITAIKATAVSETDEPYPVTVLFFDSNTGALIRRSYFRSLSAYNGGASPDKILEVTSTQCIDGIVTPVQMVMTAQKGNSSELSLRDAAYGHSSIDWDSLSIQALPSIAEKIRSLPPRRFALNSYDGRDDRRCGTL